MPPQGSDQWCRWFLFIVYTVLLPNASLVSEQLRSSKHWRLAQRKVYCRAIQARRTGVPCSKNPELPNGSGGKVFIGQIWGEGCRVCDFWLAGGEVRGQRIRNLELSLKLPSSVRVRGPQFRQKNSKLSLCISLQGEPEGHGG